MRPCVCNKSTRLSRLKLGARKKLNVLSAAASRLPSRKSVKQSTKPNARHKKLHRPSNPEDVELKTKTVTKMLKRQKSQHKIASREAPLVPKSKDLWAALSLDLLVVKSMKLKTR